MYCGGFLLQTVPQTWFSFSLRGTWPDLLTSICRESNRSFPSKQPTTTTILPSRRCLEPIDPFPRPIEVLFAASVDSNSSEGIVSPEDRCNDRVSLPLLYRRHSSPPGYQDTHIIDPSLIATLHCISEQAIYNRIGARFRWNYTLSRETSIPLRSLVNSQSKSYLGILPRNNTPTLFTTLRHFFLSWAFGFSFLSRKITAAILNEAAVSR